MEQPTITAESIAHFHELFAEYTALNEQAGAELSGAKLNQDLDLTIARDGKAITVKERVLWEEVWHLGAGSDGGKVLKEKYPSVFEASQNAEKKKREFQAFAREQWNIDPFALSLSDIIRIVEGVVSHRLAKKV